MKDFIKQLLRKELNEAEFNYHIGQLGSDLKNIKPYGSDNIVMMSGRHTGHFGSGVYFSTYNCKHRDFREFDKEYGNVDVHKKELTEFQKAYRVDFDIYKNLFRVKSNEHGEMLYETLKLINQSFHLVVSIHDSKFEMDKYFSNLYLKIKHNINKLGLKIPNYRDYIEMVKLAAKDMKDKSNLASMSTRIMEYNGFNGVNVSGISMFDNTIHGSVIYDMSKVSDKPIPVKNPDTFCHIKKSVIGLDYKDIETSILRGEKISVDEFLSLPNNLKLLVLNRSNFYFNRFHLDKLDNKIKQLYYSSIQRRIQNETLENFPERGELEQMIEDGYLNIIYNPKNKIDDMTFLEYAISISWRLSDDIKEKLLNNINRELTPEEKKEYNNISDDVY